jgi:hypothetical protein
VRKLAEAASLMNIIRGEGRQDLMSNWILSIHTEIFVVIFSISTQNIGTVP